MPSDELFVLIGHGAGDVIEMFLSADNRQIKLHCTVCHAELIGDVPTRAGHLQNITLRHTDECAFWRSIQTSLDQSRAAGGN